MFGGLTIERPTGDRVGGAASQISRLALLAFVAVSGPLGVARERVLAMFWPEKTNADARRALKQAVYALRQSLGEFDVIEGPDPLRVTAATLSCDVTQFESALERGDVAKALSLYAGPFLDGVVLRGAPDFERWANSMRERLHRRIATALEGAARSAMSVGDVGVALCYWEKLHELAPWSDRAARGYAEALLLSGDRMAATRLLQGYIASCRSEWDSEPSAEVLQLDGELRRAPQQPMLHTPGIEHPTTSSPAIGDEVVDLYLRGRHQWSRRGNGLLRSQRLFRRAIEAAPNYAPAHAGLADSVSFAALLGFHRADAVRSLARTSAYHALSLDPALPEAHYSVGLYELFLGRDDVRAERALREAARLQPSWGFPLAHLAQLLVRRNEPAEAHAMLMTAMQREPLSASVAQLAGVSFVFLGAHDAAARAAARVRELDPAFPTASALHGLIQLARGRASVAMDAFEEATADSGRAPLWMMSYGLAAALAGEARVTDDVLTDLSQRSVGDPLMIEVLRCARGGMTIEPRSTRYLHDFPANDTPFARFAPYWPGLSAVFRRAKR